MEHLVQFLSDIFPSDPGLGQIGSIDMNITLAHFTGLPLLGLKAVPRAIKIILILYGTFMIPVITFLYTGFELYDLALNWNDLDALAQNTCLSLTHLAGAWKVINTFWRLSDIRECIAKLKTIIRKFTVSVEQREAFLRGESENKIFLGIYLAIVGLTALLCMLMLVYYQEGVVGKLFPFRVQLPAVLPYKLRLFYIGMGVSFAAFQIVSIDYLNIAMMNHLRYQLDILVLAFDEIKVTTLSGKEVTEKLYHNVQHHCALMELRNDVESIYRFPVLLQFFTSLLIFAMTGFRATVSTGTGKGDMAIYFYSGCIFCQLFFYCWFGNEVSEKCKALPLSGFNSPWYEFNKEYKQSLLIFLENAQRPLLFTAGGFMQLSLPSFTGILSKSYSFIALLRQLNAK